MRTMLMEMTPAQASELLRKNYARNRSIRPSRVAALTAAIKRGEWLVTHQGIALARDGTLLDGQHRLSAIAAAGVTVWINVSFDVDETAFIAFDTGIQRSVADLTGIPRDHVSVARIVAQILEGNARTQQFTSAQAVKLHAWLGSTLTQIDRACPTRPKVRGAAAVRVGVAARMLAGNPEAVASAYRAFAHLDLPNIPPGAAALLKQIESGKASVRLDSTGFAARAWIAFDLRKKAISLRVVDISATLAAMRAVFEKAQGGCQ